MKKPRPDPDDLPDIGGGQREERASDKNAVREQALSYPAVGAMTGGFVGLLGIYLGFVQEVSLAGGGVGSFVVRGTQDLSGQFAALGAIVAFAGGGAMLLMGTERPDARINRWATMAAGVGPVFLLAFSATGLSARTQRSSQRRR